ncbi:MAG: DUF4214 domain-containing protein [Ferrovum sp.]|nr:DUF4214 domain-containing protein [Ferrovum sp.]
MQINLSWDSSVASAPSSFKTEVQQAANMLDQSILNNVTVTIQVGWGEDGGASIPSSAAATGGPSSTTFASYGPTNNSQAIATLKNQALLNGYQDIATTLPASNPFGSNYLMLSATEAKVLGVSNPYPAKYDGSIGFSTTDTTISSAGIVGIALHELTHALGRVNGWVDSQGTSWYTPLDLYTYSAPGQLWNPSNTSTPGYFSIDGGVTNLGNFSTWDPADFSNTITDPFGAQVAGSRITFTSLDLQVMQTLGFNTTSSSIGVAYDLGTTQSPGEAALLLGAAFGTQVVNDRVLVGDWIKLFDNGGTLLQGARALVGSGNISAADNASFVTALWQHVIGTPIDATDLALYTNALANGTFTQASLLVAAADTAPNQAHLNLTGLGQTGLGFTPVSTNAQGIESVSYASASTNYTLTGNPGAGTITVTGAAGADTLIGVQHVKFTNVKLAFDMGSNQAGGQAAELIGAAYGDSALSNQTLVASSLTTFDGGSTMQQAAQNVAASMNLSNTAFISTLWQHVIGTPIDAVDLASLINSLTNGTFTQASLLSFAAENPINQNHVNLVGLAQHGLVYA